MTILFFFRFFKRELMFLRSIADHYFCFDETRCVMDGPTHSISGRGVLPSQYELIEPIQSVTFTVTILMCTGSIAKFYFYHFQLLTSFLLWGAWIMDQLFSKINLFVYYLFISITYDPLSIAIVYRCIRR